MKIELLKRENLEDLKEIGEAFTAEVAYPGGFVFSAFEKLWSQIMEMNMGAIFVVRDGDRVVAALGCSFMEDGFNGRMTAAENWWFAHKEYRGAGIASQLFDAFEATAAFRGAKKLIMGRLETPEAGKLDSLYLKRGYQPIEKTFGKEI